MTGELILSFFLIAFLRKSLKKYSPFSRWSSILKTSIWVLGLLFALTVSSVAPNVARWLDHLVLFSIIAITYTQPDFKFAKNLIVAVLPFAIVSLLQDFITFLPHTFSSSIGGYLAVIYPCTIAWMIAMFFIYNRQRKALLKEHEQREKEAEENRLVAARKAELETMVTERTTALLLQKEELEQTLSELKNTQAQLIQSEKMASLGELTAGIAHEIQNPLNFVNNFSDVNKELIEEMEMEIRNGNMDEVLLISADIKENELKINQHGKRADSIVKGMLQHSRKSSGQKELADINALADEYLRLSYHGLRAKDKSFNSSFKTDFDEKVGKILVIPQDISRVLLNLFNNAFYSVNEKKKLTESSAGSKYDPMVCVSTKNAAGIVSICIKDNGKGIPKAVLDKIYQPFFTTKPSGQGTGLGLSMSYEIIKAHGGELRVETKEGEFAAFTIELPAENKE